MITGDKRVQALETELIRVRHVFEAAMNAVPADKLHLAPEGRWSPAQILWHVAKVERGVARMIEMKSAAIGQMTTVPPGPAVKGITTLLDKFPFHDRTRKISAPEGLAPPATIDLIAERGRWVDGRKQLLAAAYAAGPNLSLIRHDHPVFGSFDGWQWVLMIARHEERHMLQLQEVLASTQ